MSYGISSYFQNNGEFSFIVGEALRNSKGDEKMDSQKVFANYPVLQSDQLVLKKIEEIHLQDLYAIYDNDYVFQYCGITAKHNIQTVSKMIGHFERDY